MVQNRRSRHPNALNDYQDESQFRAEVIAILRRLGFLATAIRRSDGITIGDVGFPDVIAVHPVTGALVVLELKMPHGRTTEPQERWLSALGDPVARRGRADLAIVLRPVDWPDVCRACVELAGRSAR